ncbi:MAG: hypothetical protein ACE5GS_10185 [Kiloniellaceae bacterium]
MASWQDSNASSKRRRLNGLGLRVGQRYHRVGLPAVVWRVVRVYRDAQGLEHATLACEARNLDKKTLSAAVLQDRSRYRLI